MAWYEGDAAERVRNSMLGGVGGADQTARDAAAAAQNTANQNAAVITTLPNTYVATLPDATVSGATATLAAGVSSLVTTANATVTAPAVAGTYDATKPQRFAVSNQSGSTITLSMPNVSGTTISISILSGESRVYRQSGSSGYRLDSGIPLAQQDARYLASPALTGTPTINGDAFAEYIQDTVAGFIVAGSNVTKTYDDTGNTLTLAAVAGGAGASDPVMSGPGMFNVKNSSYNAVGDGTTNDRSALASAIADAKTYLTNNPTKRATVYVPPGEYRINYTTYTVLATWVSNLSLVGAGNGQTIIKCYSVDGSGNQTNGILATFLGSNTSRTSPLSQCVFKDFTLDMTNVDPGRTSAYNTGAKAFYFQYTSRCTWSNLNIIGSPASAIGVDYDMGGTLINGCRLISCGRSTTNGSSGVGLGTGGYALEPSLVINNYAENCANFGFFSEKQGSTNTTPYLSTGTIYANNIAVGCRAGFGDSGSGYTLYTNNQSINATQYAFHIQSGNSSGSPGNARPAGPVLHRNTMMGAQQAGIRVDTAGTPPAVLMSNRIVGFDPVTGAITTLIGIHVNIGAGSTTVNPFPRIIDNDIEFCAGTGIYAYISTNSSILATPIMERNRVRSCGRNQDGTNQFGMRLRHTSTQAVIRSNVVWDDMPATAPLAADAAVGATTLTCYYNYQMGLPPTGTYVFESETVTVTAVSAVTNMDTLGTYTMTLSAATTTAHATGVIGAQASPTQTVGISIPAGSSYTDAVVTDNISRTGTGITAWSVSLAAFLGASIVRNNVGLNPLGIATLAASGSPMTITAGPSPETIYISGGTVSAVSKGGVTLPTSGQYPLEPNESLIVTYSSAPTIVRDKK